MPDIKKMKCIIVDDEALAIEGLVNYCGKVDFMKVVGTSSSAIEAAEILKSHDVDLMFLDINMPHLSGLDFLESLEKPPLVILTTAYSEYALDGYRLNVADYLLKPIGFERFFQASVKANDLFAARLSAKSRQKDRGIFVRQNGGFRRIEATEILYAEGMQNYVKLHLLGETIVIHQTMASLEKMLPPHDFFRVHRSYIVNISHISSVAGNRVIVNGEEIPLSSQRMDDFMSSIVYRNLISK